MISQTIKNIKHKKIWVPLILLSLFSVVYINLQVQRVPSPDRPLAPALASPSPSPKLPLKLTNTYPPAGPSIITMPYLAFVFTFNQPISTSDFQVDTKPKVDLKLSLSPDKYSLYASPAQRWKFNQEYTITLFGPGNTQITQQKTIFLDPSKYPPEDFDEKINF